LLRPGAQCIANILLGVAARRSLSDGQRANLEHAFASGSAPTQAVASFRGQVRAEVYVTCGDLEAAVRALRDADANGLIDVCWLENCPLLHELHGHAELETIRSSTALRAARVREALNGLASTHPNREPSLSSVG
jgi:hypothetical protein